MKAKRDPFVTNLRFIFPRRGHGPAVATAMVAATAFAMARIFDILLTSCRLGSNWAAFGEMARRCDEGTQRACLQLKVHAL